MLPILRRSIIASTDESKTPLSLNPRVHANRTLETTGALTPSNQPPENLQRYYFRLVYQIALVVLLVAQSRQHERPNKAGTCKTPVPAVGSSNLHSFIFYITSQNE